MIEVRISEAQAGQIAAIQRNAAGLIKPGKLTYMLAQTLNRTAQRSISERGVGIKAVIKSTTNLTHPNKYLKNVARVKPRATTQSLSVGVNVNAITLPIIAFGAQQTSSGVSFAIYRGKLISLPHAFIATMPTGHRGVYGAGKYTVPRRRSGFVSSKINNNLKGLTEMHTTTPAAIVTQQQAGNIVRSAMGRNLVNNYQGYVQSQIDKLK